MWLPVIMAFNESMCIVEDPYPSYINVLTKIAITLTISIVFVFIQNIIYLKPNIPRPKMVRQICDQKVDRSKNQEPRIIQPLLWAQEPIVKNSILIPTVPEELKTNCITATGHFNEAKLAVCLEQAFTDLGLSYTREEDVYRWDVRLPGITARLDTILEIRVFYEETGALTVYFNKHFGYDSMIAYELFDQIARNSYLDIVGSTNPITKVDDW